MPNGLCESCPKQAVFNLPGVKKGRFCSTHKDPEMINIYKRVCKHEGCENTAGYRVPGGPLVACSIHKTLDMIYHVTCRHQDCTKLPSYGQAGTKTREYCVEHKKDGMIFVGKRTCQGPECSKQPFYGFTKPPLFCREHKEAGMVDLFTKRCEFEGCAKIQPNFNFSGEEHGRFCLTHKMDGMINVNIKRCAAEGCTTGAGFGQPGGPAEYCSRHKKADMVFVLAKRTCEHEDCTKTANFNIPGQKPPVFCSQHKSPGMMNVMNNLCVADGCTVQPSYNFEGTKRRLYCAEHRLEGMIQIHANKCIFEMCENRISNTKKYKGYCFRCYMHLFPDAPVTNRYKTKEMSVRDFLNSSFPDVTITHDKRVQCHLYRPDFVIDMGTHTVVIEVDENQHETYDTSCDNKRLMSIFQGLGSRPMVMIRFNPDEYDDVKSCWTRNGTMVDKGAPWRKRLTVLKSVIETRLGQEPVREVTIEHLFYDGYTGLGLKNVL